jgi:hypothetical protein
MIVCKFLWGCLWNLKRQNKWKHNGRFVGLQSCYLGMKHLRSILFRGGNVLCSCILCTLESDHRDQLRRSCMNHGKEACKCLSGFEYSASRWIRFQLCNHCCIRLLNLYYRHRILLYDSLLFHLRKLSGKHREYSAILPRIPNHPRIFSLRFKQRENTSYLYVTVWVATIIECCVSIITSLSIYLKILSFSYGIDHESNYWIYNHLRTQWTCRESFLCRLLSELRWRK